MAKMTPEQAVEVRRDFLVQVDSLTSLVAYRYATGLPDDVVRDVKAISQVARKLYEGK